MTDYSFKPEEVSVSTHPTTPVEGMVIGKPPSGIEVVHLPTGKVFTCEEHRSQHRNRAVCFEMLQEWLNSLVSYSGMTVRGVATNNNTRQPYLFRNEDSTEQDNSFRKILDKATEDGKLRQLPDDVNSEREFINWIKGEG